MVGQHRHEHDSQREQQSDRSSTTRGDGDFQREQHTPHTPTTRGDSDYYQREQHTPATREKSNDFHREQQRTHRNNNLPDNHSKARRFDDEAATVDKKQSGPYHCSNGTQFCCDNSARECFENSPQYSDSASSFPTPAVVQRLAAPPQGEVICQYECKKIGASLEFKNAGEAMACVAKCGGGFTNTTGDTQMCPRVAGMGDGLAPCLNGDEQGTSCAFRKMDTPPEPNDALFLMC